MDLNLKPPATFAEFEQWLRSLPKNAPICERARCCTCPVALFEKQRHSNLPADAVINVSPTTVSMRCGSQRHRDERDTTTWERQFINAFDASGSDTLQQALCVMEAIRPNHA